MEKETYSEASVPLRYSEGWHELLIAPAAADYQQWMEELGARTQQGCEQLENPPDWAQNPDEIRYRWQRAIEMIATATITPNDLSRLSQANVIETALLTLQANVEALGWNEDGLAFTIVDLLTGEDVVIDLRTLPGEASESADAAPQPLAEARMLGEDLTSWHNRMAELMQQGAHIIALRGAGSVNGIHTMEAEIATALVLDEIMELIDKNDPVALIYDGDTDDRERPDIGAIFGLMADHLQDFEGVSCLAVQSEGWYSPHAPGAALRSASGVPYETFVFSDALSGAHSELSQSDLLVGYERYRQVFVGPAGRIAAQQLEDLNRRAAQSQRRVPVTIIKTSNNPTLDDALRAKLSDASETERQTIEAKIAARAEWPYGLLFTQKGTPRYRAEDYPFLAFNVISSTLPDTTQDEIAP